MGRGTGFHPQLPFGERGVITTKGAGPFRVLEELSWLKQRLWHMWPVEVLGRPGLVCGVSPRCGCNDILGRCQPTSLSHRYSLLAAPVPRTAPGLRAGPWVASEWPEETEATEAWGSAIQQKCISVASDHQYPHDGSNQTERNRGQASRKDLDFATAK